MATVSESINNMSTSLTDSMTRNSDSLRELVYDVRREGNDTLRSESALRTGGDESSIRTNRFSG